MESVGNLKLSHTPAWVFSVYPSGAVGKSPWSSVLWSRLKWSHFTYRLMVNKKKQFTKKSSENYWLLARTSPFQIHLFTTSSTLELSNEWRLWIIDRLLKPCAVNWRCMRTQVPQRCLPSTQSACWPQRQKSTSLMISGISMIAFNSPKL